MSSRKGHIRSPFKFLDPYNRKDGAVFFGRTEEVENLYESVNKNRLVLLYGQSGTGKTSVVQCGLANRFEVTDWLPFFIRRGKDINVSLRQALSQSKALGGLTVGPDTLLDALGRISSRYVRPVYLIFDQFEELLILGSQAEKDAFLATIQDVLNSEKARPCHLLFILREEYFANLDEFERVIPGFTGRRLRIEPMRPARLEEVILQSCEQFNIQLEKGTENARQMVGSLRSKGGIALPYLQVYLDMLWREDFARTYPQGWDGEGAAPLEFTTAEIEDLGAIEDVLERFLAERTNAIQEELAGQFTGLPADTVRSALDDFVTEEGTKRPVSYRRDGQLLQLSGVAPPFLKQLSPEVLAACLLSLERSRLLRADEDTYELAHDSLAALLDQKRTEEQRHLNELRRQIRSSHRIYRQTGDYLTGKQLVAYEGDIPLLGLSDELQQFVEESRRFREEEENRQLQDARATAEKERGLREEAQQNERRAHKRTRLAIIVTLVAIALAVLSGFFYIQSNRQRQRAEAATEEAVENAALATENAKEARENLQLAEANAKKARENADEAGKAREEAEANLALAEKNEKQAKENLGRAEAGEEQAKLNAAAAEKAREEAESNLELAEQREGEAKAAQAETQQALNSLQAANARIAKGLRQEIGRHILQLGYTEALEKCKTIQALIRENELVAEPLLEIAFVYTESGQYDRAKETLVLAGESASEGGNKSSDERQGLLDAIRRRDANFYEALLQRYYPEMALVPGGAFLMGNEDYEREEKPVHEITLDGFMMARAEVTVWQYYLFTEANGKILRSPDWGLRGDNPVVNVSWYEALEYANWLSRQMGYEPAYSGALGSPEVAVDWQAKGFRLPTEAEWEYAAKGGQDKKNYAFSGTDSLVLAGWYYDNSDAGDGIRRTRPVAGKMPNALNLFDMSGNVAEWCWDWFDRKYYLQCRKKGTLLNPKGPENGSWRVIRGGSYYWTENRCRVTYRYSDTADFISPNYGFRLVRNR